MKEKGQFNVVCYCNVCPRATFYIFIHTGCSFAAKGKHNQWFHWDNLLSQDSLNHRIRYTAKKCDASQPWWSTGRLNLHFESGKQLIVVLAQLANVLLITAFCHWLQCNHLGFCFLLITASFLDYLRGCCSDCSNLDMFLQNKAWSIGKYPVQYLDAHGALKAKAAAVI